MIAITDFKKYFTRWSKLLNEYRSALKPGETEEVISQFFNRPLAFLTAKIFFKLRRSPNFITMFSMFFGVSAGFMFAQGEYNYILAGVVLLELMIIFDCADGQLARMTGKSSSFGKTLDASADLATHMSVFYGVAFAVFARSGNIGVFFLALIAQASMYVHIFLFDHFKNVFIRVARPEYCDKLESINDIKESCKKEKLNNRRFNYKWLAARMYYIFYHIEEVIVSIGYLPYANSFYDLFPDTERLDSLTREIYYQEMRGSIKTWTFLGDTTHLMFFIVFGILNKLALVFPVMIISTNIFCIFTLFYQRIKFKKLGLEREILWQERV